MIRLLFEQDVCTRIDICSLKGLYVLWRFAHTRFVKADVQVGYKGGSKMRKLTRAMLCASAVLALTAARASAENVEWKDDGTVLIKLGEAYNNQVIQTTKEELGSEFGPGKKPFEGVTITVTVNGAGPKGGISGPLYQFRPIWEELSGGKVNIVELPFAEHYTKMMLDLRNGTGQYDAFMVGAFWYGDIVPAGYAYPIDDLQKSGKYPKWTYDDMPPSLSALHHWNNVGYGVLNDGDGQILYYRSDVLSDPKWQADFKKEYGYDLPAPPQTWQQQASGPSFAGEPKIFKRI